ncbi:MAG: hypothetical protein U1F38_02515 [Ottowia sp.]
MITGFAGFLLHHILSGPIITYQQFVGICVGSLDRQQDTYQQMTAMALASTARHAHRTRGQDDPRDGDQNVFVPGSCWYFGPPAGQIPTGDGTWR